VAARFHFIFADEAFLKALITYVRQIPAHTIIPQLTVSGLKWVMGSNQREFYNVYKVAG